tara:strand:- start:4813 stop:5553 length:741 start_codon:yes stop_codon:yes gene_type:complete
MFSSIKNIGLTPKSVSIKDFVHEWHTKFRDYLLTLEHQFDPAHKIDHVDRVTKTALNLAEQENAEIKIILPAIMLHECVPVSKFSQNRAMASTTSAEKARKLLIQWEYPNEYLGAIEHAIKGHSFSANILPASLEAKVVQDADRLDALGVIGFARTLGVGFKHNNSLYDTKQPIPYGRSVDDNKYILDHFYQKLFVISGTMQTKAGTLEAKRRHQIMEKMIENLCLEIGVPYFSYEEYATAKANRE